MRIEVQSLSAHVFERVRERIISGRLASDQHIRQDVLAAELGVSKIPLREALVRLEQAGLLFNRVNRGFFVRPMSIEQAEEIYELRLANEPKAAAYAATHADDAARAAVSDAFDALDRATLDNLPDVAVRNREFHVALVRPGGKVLTTQIVERLSVLSERYVVAHLAPSGRGSRAHDEHAQLLDAFQRKDGDRLEELLSGHIAATLVDLRTQFDAA